MGRVGVRVFQVERLVYIKVIELWMWIGLVQVSIWGEKSRGLGEILVVLNVVIFQEDRGRLI